MNATRLIYRYVQGHPHKSDKFSISQKSPRNPFVYEIRFAIMPQMNFIEMDLLDDYESKVKNVSL